MAEIAKEVAEKLCIALRFGNREEQLDQWRNAITFMKLDVQVNLAGEPTGEKTFQLEGPDKAQFVKFLRELSLASLLIPYQYDEKLAHFITCLEKFKKK